MPKNNEEKDMKNAQALSEPNYASFYKRIFATIIDVMLSSIIFLPLFSLMTAEPPQSLIFLLQDLNQQLAAGAITLDQMTNQLSVFFETSPEGQAFVQQRTNEAILQTILGAAVIFLFWKYRAATPGKMLLKMRIVDIKTLGPASNAQLLLRFFGYIPSVLFLGIGFLWVYYNKKRQGWHDLIARTAVINVDQQKPT